MGNEKQLTLSECEDCKAGIDEYWVPTDKVSDDDYRLLFEENDIRVIIDYHCGAQLVCNEQGSWTIETKCPKPSPQPASFAFNKLADLTRDFEHHRHETASEFNGLRTTLHALNERSERLVSTDLKTTERLDSHLDTLDTQNTTIADLLARVSKLEPTLQRLDQIATEQSSRLDAQIKGLGQLADVAEALGARVKNLEVIQDNANKRINGIDQRLCAATRTFYSPNDYPAGGA